MNKAEAQQAIKQAVRQTIDQKMQSGATPGASPPQAGQAPVSQFFQQQQVSVGPLPAPEVLKLYGEAVPNGSERIMQMAEKEQRHSHRLHYLSIALTFSGEFFAALVVLCAMIGAFWLVYKNKTFEGAAAFVSAIGLLVAGYWERRRQQDQVAPRQPPRDS